MTQKDEAAKALKYLARLSCQLKKYSDNGSYPNIDSKVSAGMLYEFAKEIDSVIAKCKAALSEDKASLSGEQDSEPVAKVIFNQDEDGLQPVAFYSHAKSPPNNKLKEKFVVMGVYLKPQEWVGLSEQDLEITFGFTNEGWAKEKFNLAKLIEAKLKEVNGYD